MKLTKALSIIESTCGEEVLYLLLSNVTNFEQFEYVCRVSETAREIIQGTFNWSESEQGHEYWSAVTYKLFVKERAYEK